MSVRRVELIDADCGIEQALGVLTDWWTFLVVRDIAGGVTRFEALQRSLGVSRRALTERLAALVSHGVLRREAYSEHPPRFDYLLTAKGEGLLPVLIALQDWGTRHVLGDGSLTATAAPTSAEAHRVHGLVGHLVPVVPISRWTVLYFFPGAYPSAADYPPGWGDIPGAGGCTLESLTYASRADDFAAAGVQVKGVSTQRPDQLEAFAAHAGLPFPLVSDQDAKVAAGLRLPTFRASGVDRFKRLSLLVDASATIRAVQYPITDPAASVTEMLELATGFGLARTQPAIGGSDGR
ncbi:putative HXlR-family transcriptional regulator [Actinoplanes friuliensis DSM 7358]|uniref:Putative HXlR-family transcriptional regulator n=1 Tax=Actinoplanes friuliensis DSM 7358 TaxID=1246995 RepID=U5WBQ1_9ACTN|nr:putative HXlR-family transcriptional regulator [Actinoplanes friuliensis DSM 7358]